MSKKEEKQDVTVAEAVAGFESAISGAVTFVELQKMHGTVETFAHNQETSGIYVRALFWKQTKVIYDRMKHAGEDIKQKDVAAKLDVDAGQVSRAFKAIEENENYLKDIADGKIMADGRQREVTKKATPKQSKTAEQRAQGHIDKLVGVMEKASADEKDAIRAYAMDKLPSVFRRVIEEASTQPSKVVKVEPSQPVAQA